MPHPANVVNLVNNVILSPTYSSLRHSRCSYCPNPQKHTLSTHFPGIGKFQGVFSRRWKFLSKVFQPLEDFVVVFPIVGCMKYASRSNLNAIDGKV
jgi:hypothetical protein